MWNQLQETTAFLQAKGIQAPRIGIVLGSGLGGLANRITNPVAIDYHDIPNMPTSSVSGHLGQFIFGQLNGVDVVLMAGRFHYYEGISMQQIAFPIYLMKQLGAQTLIVSNACGGINKNFSPGTIMLIDDFINLMGDSPLRGDNDERIGPRFPDMTEPYSKALQDIAVTVGKELGMQLERGIYAGFFGPYYETRAEIKMIAGMGADAVGMSTVPETIAANHCGMKVLGISVITNMATGIQTMKHSHENVLAIANKSTESVTRLVETLVSRL